MAHVFVFSVLILFGFSGALEIDPAWVETTCPPVLPDPSLNMTWLTSVGEWYIPYFSQGGFHTLLKLLMGSQAYSQVKEEDLPKSCLRIGNFGANKVVVTAFGQTIAEERAFLSNPVRPGVIDWELKKGSGYVGTSYLVLTDNRTYFITYFVILDGTKGFYVASTHKTLPSDTLQKIMDTLTNLGFDQKLFAKFRYDHNCPK